MPSKNIYRLKNVGLPAMSSAEDFANATKLSSNKIIFLSYQSASLYKTYNLKKKSEGYRKIAQPSRELKALQAWILRNILDKLSSSPYSKGFELGSSIVDNAQPHVGANYILTIDLENFFPSIMASKVYTVFSSIGYNKEMTTILTNICVYEGGLPQGAPTSPKLANLICSKLDARIQGYAGHKGITYTRYADDITLSANTVVKIQKAKKFLDTIITNEDLQINSKKTKICGTKRQKKITGLILSDKSIGIGRVKFREIRAQIHYLFLSKNDNYAETNGTLSFVYSVDKKAYNKLYTYIDKLTKKYPQSEATTKITNKIKRK